MNNNNNNNAEDTIESRKLTRLSQPNNNNNYNFSVCVINLNKKFVISILLA